MEAHGVKDFEVQKRRHKPTPSSQSRRRRRLTEEAIRLWIRVTFQVDKQEEPQLT